jgi:hypothetical protein
MTIQGDLPRLVVSTSGPGGSITFSNPRERNALTIRASAPPTARFACLPRVADNAPLTVRAAKAAIRVSAG